MEILTGGLWVLRVHVFGAGLDLLPVPVLVGGLVAPAFIDPEHYFLPDRIVSPLPLTRMPANTLSLMTCSLSSPGWGPSRPPASSQGTSTSRPGAGQSGTGRLQAEGGNQGLVRGRVADSGHHNCPISSLPFPVAKRWPDGMTVPCAWCPVPNPT